MLHTTQQDVDRCKTILMDTIGEENIFNMELAVNNVMNISYSKGCGYSEQELTTYIIIINKYQRTKSIW